VHDFSGEVQKFSGEVRTSPQNPAVEINITGFRGISLDRTKCWRVFLMEISSENLIHLLDLTTNSCELLALWLESNMHAALWFVCSALTNGAIESSCRTLTAINYLYYKPWNSAGHRGICPAEKVKNRFCSAKLSICRTFCPAEDFYCHIKCPAIKYYCPFMLLVTS
jgi:hypothetical protein